MLNSEKVICPGFYLSNCCVPTPIARAVQGMELEEKEVQKDESIHKILLEETYS